MFFVMVILVISILGGIAWIREGHSRRAYIPRYDGWFTRVKLFFWGSVLVVLGAFTLGILIGWVLFLIGAGMILRAVCGE